MFVTWFVVLVTGAEANTVIRQVHQRLPGLAVPGAEKTWRQGARHKPSVPRADGVRRQIEQYVRPDGIQTVKTIGGSELSVS